jgi:hypothetical protein
MSNEMHYPRYDVSDGFYHNGEPVKVLVGDIAGRPGVVIGCKATSPDVRKYRVSVAGRGDNFWFYQHEIAEGNREQAHHPRPPEPDHA